MAPRNVPSVGALVAIVVHLALAAAFVVGVATQPTRAADDDPARCRFEDLVLDGSGVTTTAPPRTRRPVDKIPQRSITGPRSPAPSVPDDEPGVCR